MKELLGIISDDLTGAADTIVQFTLQKRSGLVVFHPCELPSDVDVVAVDSASRSLAEKDTVAAMLHSAHLLKRFPITSLYKKIDSTLRGHLALEIETLLKVFDMESALVAPAYPANARITAGGYQLVAQIPVAESEMARDPLCPVHESHLPTLFRKTSRLKIGHLSLAVLQDGLHAVQKATRHLRAEGAQIIISDATRPEHLTILANFLRYEPGILACGSAGLAKALASRMSSSPRVKQIQNHFECRSSTRVPPVLIVSGSCSQKTLRQIKKFRSHKQTVGIPIAPERLLNHAADFYLKDIIAGATESLRAGHDTVLHLTTNSAASIVFDDGRLLADRLGKISLDVLKRASQLSGLILTGGDIARAVCEHLQIDGIEFYQELYPAVPIGRCFGGIRPGLNIITKGGGCGNENILSAAVSSLKNTFLQSSWPSPTIRI